MRTMIFGAGPLSLEDVVAIARWEASTELGEGRAFLDEMGDIYGVTTDYGDSSDKEVPRGRCWELPVNMSGFHGCGPGGCGSSGAVAKRLQDPCSIRCAPHVIGALFGALELFRSMIEISSVNDNSFVAPSTKSIRHSGHFHDGHICFAMGSLKNAIINVADLLGRRLALLVGEKLNRGLPPSLSRSAGSYSSNHGFRTVQAGGSTWTAETLKNTMPASVFSRSAEWHNQGKVNMGPIAARVCDRILELAQQVAAAFFSALVEDRKWSIA